MPKAVNIDEDETVDRPVPPPKEVSSKLNLRKELLDLIDNDPEIRGKLVLEGELRPEAYRYPRIPMVNGQKQKR